MKDEKNPLVGIAGVIGGTTIAMIALIVIFASSSAWVIAPVVVFMSLLGIMLGHFASRKK
jgi:hypothetical protein